MSPLRRESAAEDCACPLRSLALYHDKSVSHIGPVLCVAGAHRKLIPSLPARLFFISKFSLVSFDKIQNGRAEAISFRPQFE